MSKSIRDCRRAHHAGEMRVRCHTDWRKIRKADKPAFERAKLAFMWRAAS